PRASHAQGRVPGVPTLRHHHPGVRGETERLQAMRQHGASQVMAPSVLLGDMAAQLRLGEHTASGDPFGLGTVLGGSDATPHAFGLYITDALDRKYGGTGAYQAFANQQLAYALGANPWG